MYAQQSTICYSFALTKRQVTIMDGSSIEVLLLIFSSNLIWGLIVVFLLWKLNKLKRKISFTLAFLAKRLERRRARIQADKDTQTLEMVRLTKGELHLMNLGDEQSRSNDFIVQVEADTDDRESEGSSNPEVDCTSSNDSLFWRDIEDMEVYQKLISSDSDSEFEVWV